MHKVFSKALNEKYFFAEIGELSVFIIPKKGLNEKVALIAVNYGSIDNSWRFSGDSGFRTMPPGIAHFLEHEQFKKESGDISLEFAHYGSSCNAYTGHQTTTYYFSSTDHFNESLEILLKLVFTSYFNPQGIEKEKSIIEQEIRMYDDMHDFKIYDNLVKNLYHYHPIKIPIAGTIESVRTITPEMLHNCYRTFYSPSNMVAVICGDIEPHKTIEHLNQKMSKFYAASNNAKTGSEFIKGDSKIIRNLPDEPNDIYNYSTIEQMPVSTSQILIGYKETHIGLEGMALLKQNMITDILLELIFGKSSKLFSKLYEEKLIDDRFGCVYTSHKTFGFTIISAETEQPETLHKRIIEELKKILQKKPFKKRDLEQQKRKTTGKFIWTFNSPMSIASLFAGFYLNDILSIPDGKEVFEVTDIIRKITLNDIEERLEESLNDKYHVLSFIKPLGS